MSSRSLPRDLMEQVRVGSEGFPHKGTNHFQEIASLRFTSLAMTAVVSGRWFGCSRSVPFPSVVCESVKGDGSASLRFAHHDISVVGGFNDISVVRRAP